MAVPQRFTFDESFDAPLVEERETPPPVPEREPEPEPMFSQADLAAARDSAYADGHAAGLEEGRTNATTEFQSSVDRALNAAMENVVKQVSDVTAAQAEFRQRLELEAVRIGAAIARKTTPMLLHDRAVDTIETVVREVLPRLLDEPRIAIRVADDLLDGLIALMDRHKAESGFTGEFIIVADPELEGANCRIEWADGGVDLAYDRVWAEIDSVLEEFHEASGVPVTHPPPPTTGTVEPAVADEMSTAAPDDANPPGLGDC